MPDLDELSEELADLREEVTKIRATVRALTAQTTQPDPDSGDDEGGAGVEPVFESAQAWVDAQFVVLAATHAAVWCPQWHRHAAAFARLSELWRSWENANHLAKSDLTAMEEWIRNVFDHHHAILLDRNGPFADCSNGHGEHVAPPLTPTDPTSGDNTLVAAETAAELFFARSGQDYHAQPEGTK